MNKIYIYLLLISFGNIISYAQYFNDEIDWYSCLYNCNNKTEIMIQHGAGEGDFECSDFDNCEISTVTRKSSHNIGRMKYLVEYTCPHNIRYQRVLELNKTIPMSELTKIGYCNITNIIHKEQTCYCIYSDHDDVCKCRCKGDNTNIFVLTDITQCNDLDSFLKIYGKEVLLYKIMDEQVSSIDETNSKPTDSLSYFVRKNILRTNTWEL